MDLLYELELGGGETVFLRGLLLLKLSELVEFIVGRRCSAFGRPRVGCGGLGALGTGLFLKFQGNFQRCRATKIPVYELHASEDLGGRLEIVDEAVFHLQPQTADDRYHRQYGPDRQYPAPVALHHPRTKGRERRPELHLHECGRRSGKEYRRSGKEQMGDHQGNAQSHGHHPTEVHHGKYPAEHQR